MNEPIDLGSMQIDLERIMPNLRWTESVYSDRDTANEETDKLQRLGFLAILVTPHRGSLIVSAMGTDDQIGRL